MTPALTLFAVLVMTLGVLQQPVAGPPPQPSAPPTQEEAVRAFNRGLVSYLEAEAAKVTGTEGYPWILRGAGVSMGLAGAGGYGQSTVMGLIATRDMYVANLAQFAAHLDGYLQLPPDRKLAFMKRLQARADDFKEAHRRAFLNPGPVLSLTDNVRRVLANNRREFVQMLDQYPVLGLEEDDTNLFDALLTPNLSDAQLLEIGDRYLTGGRDRALEDAKKAHAETAMSDLLKYRTARFSRQHEALRAMGTIRDAAGNVMLQTPLPGQLAGAAAGVVTGEEYWDAFADMSLAMIAGGAWIIPVVGPWISAGAAAIQIVRDGHEVYVRYLSAEEATRSGTVTNPMFVFTQLDRGRAAQRSFFLAYTFGALDFNVLINQLRAGRGAAAARASDAADPAGAARTADAPAPASSGGANAAEPPPTGLLSKTELMPPPTSGGRVPPNPGEIARGAQKARELGLPETRVRGLEMAAVNTLWRDLASHAQDMLAAFARFDDLLARARQLGIPEGEIQAALQRARTAATPEAFVHDVGTDLAIVLFNQQRKTLIVAADEAAELAKITQRVRPDNVVSGEPAFLTRLDNKLRSAARGELVEWTAREQEWLNYMRRMVAEGRGDELLKLTEFSGLDNFTRIFQNDTLNNLRQALGNTPLPPGTTAMPPLPANVTDAAANVNRPIREPGSDPFAKTGALDSATGSGVTGPRSGSAAPVDPFGVTAPHPPPGAAGAAVVTGAGVVGTGVAGAREPTAESRLNDTDKRRLADVRQRLASSTDPEDKKLLAELEGVFAGGDLTVATLRLSDIEGILDLDPARFSDDPAKALDTPAPGTSSSGLLPNLPGVIPRSGDSSPTSVRLAMDEALRKAGLDMTGTFRTDAVNGTVIYTDGEVKVTGRASGGGVLLDTAPDGPVNTVGQHSTPVVDPIEFTVMPGVLADDTTSVDVDVDEDLISINDASVMNADPDDAVQLMVVVVRGAGGGTLTVEPSPQGGSSPVAKAARRFFGMLAALAPRPRGMSAQRASVFMPEAAASDDAWLAPVSQTARSRLGASHQPVRMVLTSLGGSTGEVFQAQVINDGSRPVKLTGSLVIEPIAKQAQAAVQRQLQRAIAPGRGLTAKLDAYCLQFLRVPPSAGTLFRVAPPELQKKFAPVRKILDATGRLRQAGLLKPDSDPASYVHSITQWAIWNREQKFSLESFQRAFVDHASKNIKAGGRQWTAQLEQVVRGLVPHRWQQINTVLAEAERAAGAVGKSSGGPHAPR